MHEAKAEELSRRTEGSCRCIRRAGSVSAASCRRIRQPRKVYAVLAEHIDPSCGAVVVSQDVLAEMVGVSERTIRRATAYLEEVLALVRIRVSGSVYAYALDPKEVWRAWDCQKEQAAFLTRTLVKKNGQNALVKRRLR